MRAFLEQYGIAIFVLILMAILIAFAGPVGNIIKSATNNQVANVDRIGTQEIEKTNVEATDSVYACLYNNGELVLSSHEIKNKENVMIDYGKTNQHPWSGDNDSPNLTVRTVTFLDVVKLTTCRALFHCCENLTKINNIENLDTSECTEMTYMFGGCNNLKILDVSHFNTSKVKDMSGMFSAASDCRNSFKYLDVSNFDTSNVVNMDYMFYGCKSLTNLDLSNFDTSKVPSARAMFYYCTGLTDFDLTNFNTTNIRNMSAFFAHCQNLSSVKVSASWNTSNANVTDMFIDCGIDHVTQIN